MKYNQLINILNQLKNFGACGIKTSFEDEGANFKDILVLRKLCNDLDIKLIIKIGGAEAITDINMSLDLDCDGIVAPMIESNYALKKYLKASQDILINNPKKIEIGVNLETINAHNNIQNILENNTKNIDSITIGRVDLVGSMNKDRKYINSEEIHNIINNSFGYVKSNFKHINTYLGGSINNESEDFIRKNKNLLNFIETRHIIFDVNLLLKNYKKCVELANLFEYYWLNNINNSYNIEKNKKRIEMISSRIFSNNHKKKTLILYSFKETNKSKENLIYFLDNGLIDNENYIFYINYSFSSSIDFEQYKKKYKNLNILNINSTNAWSCWFEIIKSVNIDDFNNFIFMKDKICGPFNKDNLKENWIENIVSKLNDNQVLIAGYATSPLAKIYKFPYIPDKFLCVNHTVLDLLITNNIFEKFTFNSTQDFKNHPDNKNISDNPDNGVEIILSKLLLDNNIEYCSIDTNGINNLNILKYYKEQNYIKLLEITKNLHIINDTKIKNRFFWTDNIMKKIFLSNDKKILKSLNKPRNIENIEYWK